MRDLCCGDIESTGTPDMLLMFRELDRSLDTRIPGAVSEGRWKDDPFERLLNP